MKLNTPFLHTHPYEPFNLENATKLIVGTLPPPRFTTQHLKPGDVNFCYGSIDGLLWPLLDTIFDLKLTYKNTLEAINQRKEFLKSRHIGICDIVAQAERSKIDASDLGMQNPKLRDLFAYLKKHNQIQTLLFTGGNSKNGPEYFFRKAAKEQKVKLHTISDQVPRIYEFTWGGRTIKTISLTAPSGAANRAIGALPLYKKIKKKYPEYNTFKFRIQQYTPFF